MQRLHPYSLVVLPLKLTHLVSPIRVSRSPDTSVILRLLSYQSTQVVETSCQLIGVNYIPRNQTNSLLCVRKKFFTRRHLDVSIKLFSVLVNILPSLPDNRSSSILGYKKLYPSHSF